MDDERFTVVFQPASSPPSRNKKRFLGASESKELDMIYLFDPNFDNAVVSQ